MARPSLGDDGAILALAASGALGLGVLAARRGSAAVQDRPVIPWELLRRESPKAEAVVERVLAEGGGGAEVWEAFFARVPGRPPFDPNSDLAYMADYLRAGQRVYVIGPVMQDILLRMSLAKVPPEVVRLPHPAFYIAVPGDRWSLWERDHRWLPVKGIYVRAAGKDRIELLAWAPASSPGIGEGNISFMRLDLAEARSMGLDLEDYAERLVETSPAWHARNLHRMLEGFILGGPTAEDPTERTKATMRALVRLVINTVLYVNSEGADLSVHPWTQVQQKVARRIQAELAGLASKGGRARKVRRARAKLEEKQGRLSKAKAVWLGRDFEEGRIREAVKPPKALGADKDPSLYELEPVGVAGHWKVPWRKGIRRIVYVAPYKSHRWRRKGRRR